MSYLFFFKQKKAYEMRISDWSSDVCSSDLAALARAEDDAIKRQDLILFSSNNNSFTGRIPHVKAFAVLPNGQDLVISAEALGTSGTPIGFALAVIKNFRSATGQESFTIHEYPDYAQLPEDIAVSRLEEHTSELQSLMRISYAVFC